MGPNPLDFEPGRKPAIAGESPALSGFVTIFAGKIGARPLEKRQNRGENAFVPVIPAIRPRFSPLSLGFGVRFTSLRPGPQ
jgi:hypothetical protein